MVNENDIAENIVDARWQESGEGLLYYKGDGGGKLEVGGGVLLRRMADGDGI